MELKPISRDGIPAAIARAEHYRLLNEAEQAESICMDVLALEPHNQKAIVVLVLALTDQFGSGAAAGATRRAREFVAQITDGYHHDYYAGLVWEREARAQIRRGMRSSDAYDGFRNAMELYEKAAQRRPEGNDDAILRWNTCLRTIRAANLRPPAPRQAAEYPLE